MRVCEGSSFELSPVPSKLRFPGSVTQVDVGKLLLPPSRTWRGVQMSGGDGGVLGGAGDIGGLGGSASTYDRIHGK